MMNCEEFELRGLDLDRADADAQEAAAAAKHAEICGRCSAMLESWREVKCDLRLLRESTRLDSAPARVEMRLKQELRTRREARVPRSTVVVGVMGAGCGSGFGRQRWMAANPPQSRAAGSFILECRADWQYFAENFE